MAEKKRKKRGKISFDNVSSTKIKRRSKEVNPEDNPNIQWIKGNRIDEMVENALNNGCLLWFDCGKFGNRKQIADTLLEEAMVTVGVSKEAVRKKVVRASQDLLARDGIDKISIHITRGQRWAREHAMPWMTKSIHFIHKSKIEEADIVLNSCKEQMKEALEDYLETRYEDDQKNFALENPKLYDPKYYPTKYYPTKEAMRNIFRFRYGFVPISRPSGGEISVLSKERILEEDRKFRERMKEVVEQSISMVRGSFAKIIDHLGEIVQPNKKFQQRGIDKINNFLEEFFTALNVYDDKAMSDIAVNLQKKFSNISATDIKSDDKLRESLAKSVEKIKVEFDKLPQIRLERDLDLDF